MVVKNIKFMVLEKWKMELRVKKFKVGISTTLTQNSLLIIAPKAEADYSFPQLTGRTMKT